MKFIRLDLDAVLANFTKGAARIFNYTLPEKTQFDSYDLISLFGITKGSFYKRIRGHDFWVNLEKYPWADELVKLVHEETKGQWCFLTKPMMDSGCWSGKAEWVKKSFPKHTQRLVIGAGAKSKFCTGDEDLLIDDNTKNIREWEEAGGETFLWPEVTEDYHPEKIQERLKDLRLKIRSTMGTTPEDDAIECPMCLSRGGHSWDFCC